MTDWNAHGFRPAKLAQVLFGDWLLGIGLALMIGVQLALFGYLLSNVVRHVLVDLAAPPLCSDMSPKQIADLLRARADWERRFNLSWTEKAPPSSPASFRPTPTT